MKIVNVPLYPQLFTETERVIVRNGSLEAKAFLFPSGVCGLKLSNELGEITLLPFQGQQVWRASFCDVALTMQSMFDMPYPTNDYLKTYGGFLIHCGATAMGVPAADDQHPLHGELPNHPYATAYLTLGEDDHGPYIALSGSMEYSVAFNCSYRAEPTIRLHAGASTFHASMTLTNLRHDPLAYMYLCHINFRPVDGSRLYYSAPAEASSVIVHQTATENLTAADAERLNQTIKAIRQETAYHHLVDRRSQSYDPEIVMTIHYRADETGYAHSLQQLPKGDAFYVAHRIKELPLGLRWIARTRDEDAMGLVLPATAEHFGQTYARQNGQLKVLAGQDSITLQMVVGYLSADEANQVKHKIERILAR